MEQRFILKAVSANGIDTKDIEEALGESFEAADIDASMLTRAPGLPLSNMTFARRVMQHKRTIAAIEHELLPYDLTIRGGAMKGVNMPLDLRAGIACAILARVLNEGEFIAAPKAPFAI